MSPMEKLQLEAETSASGTAGKTAWNLYSAWLTPCWDENHRMQGTYNISLIMSSIYCDIQGSKDM